MSEAFHDEMQRWRAELRDIAGGEETDSHVVYQSGVIRGETHTKTDYLLVRDGPMFERWAQHLSAAAREKPKRNWLQASLEADLERFRESAARHFEQWLRGDTDEDHAAAVFFNVNGAELVASRLSSGRSSSTEA